MPAQAHPTLVLTPLRHRCRDCGLSCQSVHVALSEEEARTCAALSHAWQLGEVVRKGRLVHQSGLCPFATPQGRCRIHAEQGALAKPAICRQYPLVLVDADGERRAGIDPGCAYANEPGGTELALPPEIPARSSTLAPEQRQAERGLLQLLGTVTRVEEALCALGGDPAADCAALQRRWLARLRAAQLERCLQLEDLSPTWRRHLSPFVRAAQLEEAPTDTSLPPHEQAWALEATRRMIFLRLASGIPVLQGVALLSLLGALSLGWLQAEDPAPSFGASLAAWLRALRRPWFWLALTPDARTMEWLARGESR